MLTSLRSSNLKSGGVCLDKKSNVIDLNYVFSEGGWEDDCSLFLSFDIAAGLICD